MQKQLGFLTALLLSGGTAAQAQIYYPMTTPSIMFPVVMNPCPGGKCPGVSAEVSRGKVKPSAPFRKARPTAPAADGSLIFAPNVSRRREHLARFVRNAKNDPAIQEIATKADQVFPMLASAMKAKGMDANNVADAYATWWIAAFDAVHGETGTRSTAVYRAVQKQAVSAILAPPRLKSATPELKQEMAEALLVQTILIDVSIEQAKNDPAKMHAIGTAVAQGALRMGLNLRTMALTEAGFAQTSRPG